jgi:hypothetical protein
MQWPKRAMPKAQLMQNAIVAMELNLSTLQNKFLSSDKSQLHMFPVFRAISK